MFSYRITMVRAKASEQRIVERSRSIVLAEEGRSLDDIADILGTNRAEYISKLA